MEVKICNEIASDEEINKYQNLKDELEHIEEEKARGFWIRTGLERIEHDEKSTSFFLNKAKSNFQKKTITSIKLDSGAEITNQKDILNELKSFYENLYTSKNGKNYNDYEIADDDVPMKFTSKQKLACEGQITLIECTEALKTFKRHKSPGCDGLTAEFYLRFWPELGPKLVESLNYSCEKGLLSLSQRRAIITLLEKKGKDSSKIKNWRPVALLNTDYKIFTKVLARRLEKNIPSIIHTDQSGFVKNRFIGESVRFTQDIIDKFDHENKTGIILQLDFEKAFDSVEWNFLLKVLHKFNIGEQFISCVKCCYTSIYSCVNNNGFSTVWFQLFRGMRQGCPLSSLLFILCAEIMSNRIRKNDSIRGLEVGGKSQKIKQFADDCTCFLKDIPSIYNLIETIKGFSLCSGLRLNTEKSVILFLGPWKNKNVDILNMAIERDTLNALGVFIGRNNQKLQEKNFEEKLPKIKGNLYIYSCRDISLCGRILITKTFGVSKIIYPLTSTEIDKKYLNIFQTEFNKYIWGYKPAKVKHSALIGDLKQGGLKALDIEANMKALRLAWLHRIVIGDGWNEIINMYLEPLGGLMFLLRCNYDTNKLSFIPKFYKDMLDFFKEILCEYAGEGIIWNNKYILIGGQSIFMRDWYEKGIIFISDLCDQYGAWLSYDAFCKKYNIRTNYLRYLGIVSAAKNALKTLNIDLAANNNFDFTSTTFRMLSGRQINITKAKSKDFYNEFIEFKLESPVSCGRWLTDYNLPEEVFYNSLILAKKCTQEPKLVSLQFKIIHNIVNCNANLFRWNISTTEICEFCESGEKDTIVHALSKCTSTRMFLNNVFELIDPHKRSVQSIDIDNFIFGVQDSAMNLMLLLIKKAIIRSRTYKQYNSPSVLFRNVLRRIIADKAALTDTKFQQKWQEYNHLIIQSELYINACTL